MRISSVICIYVLKVKKFFKIVSSLYVCYKFLTVFWCTDYPIRVELILYFEVTCPVLRFVPAGCIVVVSRVTNTGYIKLCAKHI
jgi:hypothetical protein